MLRSVLLAVTSVAFLTTTTAALADDKSDCMKGVAMIKAELKKKHPEKVLASLRDALSNTDLEVAEEDWSECITYINKARAALRQ